ncbi:hypothetical protein LNKW23_45020 [Paralimibaculum aggregatum]|uniref:Uncharacterized protein n=1 Tax=Paralimibaculum aggregatum TaxID=3036245 RepID=A0ABQ6LT69_9RHOB|nr:NHL repeat-containing protein [Limibaculum sp. NKW23]GMG85284.1 hypothetical protein LNKW23_45020 [Limibaculum sp. NKW23]
MRLPALTAAILLALAGPAPADIRVEVLAVSTAAMENPHDIVLGPGGRHLYVADVGNDRVLVLEAESLAEVDAWGADHQSGTHDVAFDAAGRLYVADTHNNRATIYAMEGTRGRLVGALSERLRGVEGVLPHPNGRVYVGGAWSGNVVAFAEGRPVAELGGLSSPHDLALMPDGTIWLADSGNDRLLLLDADLGVLRRLEGAPYGFRGPRYLAVMPDGTLIVADKNSHSVKVIAADGRLLGVIAALGAGLSPDRLRTPEGAEISGDTLWIADSGNDRVLRLRLRLD